MPPNTLKRICFMLAMALWISMRAAPAFGQGASCGIASPCQGNITVNGDAVVMSLPANTGTVYVTVSGTWTGTLQFKQSGDGGANYASANGSPQPSGTSATSTTGNGQWRFVASGLTNFEVIASASMTGTAAVTISASAGSAGSGGTQSPLTTEGDLYAFLSGANSRLPVGSNGTCLTSNGTDPVWGSCSGATSTNFSAVIADAPNTHALQIGSGGSFSATGTGTITATAVPVGGISGLGTGVGTWLATPTATNLASALGSQTQNRFFASPNGSSGNLAVRAIVAADQPATTVNSVSNDTNVTGSIATQGLTLGWTGTLAAGRLNANVVQSVANDTNVTGSISAQALTLGWSGQLSIARGGTGLATTSQNYGFFGPTSGSGAPSFRAMVAGDQPSTTVNSVSNDTNVTGSITAQALTLGWTSQLSIARGGTGQTTKAAAFNALTPMTTEGDLEYWHSSAGARLALGSNNQVLMSNGSDPTWGTVTIAGGGTGQTSASSAFNALSPLTTEGDLGYYHSSSNARLAIGTNGYCLTSNGTDPAWAACPSGFANPMTTTGDTIYGGSGGTATRLAGQATQGFWFLGANLTTNAAAAPAWFQSGFACRNVSGSSDTIAWSDAANCVEYTDNAAVAVALPTPTTLNNSNFAVFIYVGGGSSAAVTLTPAGSWTINGASTLVVSQGQSFKLVVDASTSTNWLALFSNGLLAAGTGISFTRGLYGLTIANTGVTSVALGVPTGFGLAGSPVTVTGTLTFSMPSSWTTGDLLIGNGSNSVARLPIGTNGQCLTSNGTTDVWGSCNTGGTLTASGSPVSAQGAFWTGSTTLGNSANWTYSASSGHSIIQGGNNTDVVYEARFTDSSPTGNFLHFQNAAKNADIFAVGVTGIITAAQVAAPSTPGAGFNASWFDSTNARLHDINPAGTIGTTVVGDTGATNNFLTAISAAGVISKAQPAFSNLSGSIVLAQTVLTTRGDLLTVNSTPGLARLAVGSVNTALLSNGTDPSWGTVGIAAGGTGQTTANAAFNALSPMTTEGDSVYYHSSAATRLAVGGANTVMTSNGTEPAWAAVSNAMLSNSAITIAGTSVSLGGSTSSFPSPGTIGGTTPGIVDASALNCGVLNTTACVITGYGSTSGSATFTWPAVAGTTTNPIVSSNNLSAPAMSLTATTNQLVTGASSNLTTLNFPAPSGGVTLTFPITTNYMLGGPSDTTTTHVAHSTAVAGVESFGNVVGGDFGASIAAYSAFGNFTGSSAAPGFSATPTLTGLSLNTAITFNGSGSGSASIGTAAAAGSPSTWLLPITDPTSGQALSAGTPSAGKVQLSWANGGGQAGAYTSVSSSATPTFTASSNTVNAWAITLTQNVSSSTLASSAAGQYLAFKICQDSTGGRTFVWPTGFSAATTVFPTLSTCTEQAFFWDGSNAQPLGPAQVSGSSLSALWYGPTGSAPGTPPSGFIAAWFDSTDNALKVKNSSGTVTAAVSTASCTNQVITAISDSAADTCTTLTLASAYFANQGTTTTVLHGNASGNPSWSGVSLANDTAANQGTTTTLLHGNAAGQPSFGAVATGDLASQAVTSAKMTTELTYHSCDIYINGVSTGVAIVSAQLGPETRQCFVPQAATIIEMDVAADAGTPNIIIGRNHAGTIANIVSAALATAGSGGIACSNTGGTTGLDGATTCTNTLQNTTLARGDYLQEVSGTPGGTAKAMAVHVIYASSN